jgi:hypothetical protein
LPRISLSFKRVSGVHQRATVTRGYVEFWFPFGFMSDSPCQLESSHWRFAYCCGLALARVVSIRVMQCMDLANSGSFGSLDRLSSACFSLGLGLVWVLFAFLGDWSRCACFRFELNVMVFFLILFKLSSCLVCWVRVERRHCFGTYVRTASVGIYFLTKYRETPFSPWLRPLGPSFKGCQSINHYSILFQQLRESGIRILVAFVVIMIGRP